MQQMQKVSTHRIIVRLDIDAAPAMAVVIPVGKHRSERSDEAIGNVPRARGIVIVLLGQNATERRDA